MTADTIICPECNASIPLSEALSARIEAEAQKRTQAEQAERDKELRAEFERRLTTEKEAAAAKVRSESETQLRDLQAANEEKAHKLEQAQHTELELRKQQRQLEEGKKQLELDVARRLDSERKAIEKAATDRATEVHRLKEREKDEQLLALKNTIEDLKRKVDQGSQQAQGEAAELEIEDLLRTAFPHDRVDPVAKGTRGADIVHQVHGPTGVHCGTIVWELKNAKNWSDAWLTKLKGDQRDQKAELAVLVAVSVPDEIRAFGIIDGVWVCELPVCLALAHALRSQLVAVNGARVALAGRETKTALLYNYLAGNEFRQRVEAIAEAFASMRQDLDRERTSMEKSWAKREKQIGKALLNVAGLYGDVQGIVGASLPDLAQLEIADNEEPERLTP